MLLCVAFYFWEKGGVVIFGSHLALWCSFEQEPPPQHSLHHAHVKRVGALLVFYGR